jgi:hypothetical protein
MLLRKKTGGSSIGDHEWANDGDAVEVPDTLGRDLLNSAPDEWSEATADEKPAVKPRRNTVAE